MKARRSQSAGSIVLCTPIASGFFKFRSKRSVKARKRSWKKSRRPSSTRLLTFSVWATNISRSWVTEHVRDKYSPKTASVHRKCRGDKFQSIGLAKLEQQRVPVH